MKRNLKVAIYSVVVIFVAFLLCSCDSKAASDAASEGASEAASQAASAHC